MCAQLGNMKAHVMAICLHRDFKSMPQNAKKERSDSVPEKRRQQRESTKQTIEVIEQVILV